MVSKRITIKRAAALSLDAAVKTYISFMFAMMEPVLLEMSLKCCGCRVSVSHSSGVFIHLLSLLLSYYR